MPSHGSNYYPLNHLDRRIPTYVKHWIFSTRIKSSKFYVGGGRRNATQLDKNENLRAQVPAGGVILKPTLPGYRKDHQRPERARPTR